MAPSSFQSPAAAPAGGAPHRSPEPAWRRALFVLSCLLGPVLWFFIVGFLFVVDGGWGVLVSLCGTVAYVMAGAWCLVNGCGRRELAVFSWAPWVGAWYVAFAARDIAVAFCRWLRYGT